MSSPDEIENIADKLMEVQPCPYCGYRVGHNRVCVTLEIADLQSRLAAAEESRAESEKMGLQAMDDAVELRAKLAAAEKANECYEAMKSGVAVGIADLANKLAAAEKERDEARLTAFDAERYDEVVKQRDEALRKLEVVGDTLTYIAKAYKDQVAGIKAEVALKKIGE